MRANFKGREKLNKLVKELRTQTAPQVQIAVAEAADLLVAEQKRLAPIASQQELHSGQSPGALRSSIRWQWSDKSENLTKASVIAGDDKVDYAKHVEFGTSSMQAIPFFFTAYRALRRRIRRIIQAGVKKAVRQAAQ